MAHTYTTLKQDVADWMHRGDLTTKMDTFLELGESNINRDLRVKENELRVDVIFDQTFYPLPDDYLEMRAMHINIAGARVPLQQITMQTLDSRYSRAQGHPRAYAIHGGEIEFRPGIDNTGSPIVTYPGELTYFAKVPTLLTNPTTSILDAYPNLYLAAMMVQATMFVQDKEQLGIWIGVYDNEIQTANKTSKKGRYVNPSVQLT